MADLIEAILTDAGYEVLGPFHSAQDGVEALATLRPDAALLDVRLARGTSFGVAEELERRNVPFALVSGAARGSIDGRYRTTLFLAKPFGETELLETVEALVQAVLRAPAHAALRPIVAI